MPRLLSACRHNRPPSLRPPLLFSLAFALALINKRCLPQKDAFGVYDAAWALRRYPGTKSESDYSLYYDKAFLAALLVACAVFLGETVAPRSFVG
jgi:hypothetical protein